MEILENNIVVEVDKKVAISFNKKYKDFEDANGEIRSLELKEVKKEIAEYLLHNKKNFEGKKVFSFVYDYDSNIAVTIMRRNPDYEVYDIIGFSDMASPEETIEDDEEAMETKRQIEILKENEKIQVARKLEGAKQLESIYEGLGG